jgi:hypothetical protein
VSLHRCPGDAGHAPHSPGAQLPLGFPRTPAPRHAAGGGGDVIGESRKAQFARRVTVSQKSDAEASEGE